MQRLADVTPQTASSYSLAGAGFLSGFLAWPLSPLASPPSVLAAGLASALASGLASALASGLASALASGFSGLGFFSALGASGLSAPSALTGLTGAGLA